MQVLAKLFCMSNKNLHVNAFVFVWCFDFFVVGFVLFGVFFRNSDFNLVLNTFCEGEAGCRGWGKTLELFIKSFLLLASEKDDILHSTWGHF